MGASELEERLWEQMVHACEDDDVVFAIEACHALVENVRDIVILVKPDGRIALANAAAERAYGYPRAELHQMSVLDLRAPHTIDAAPLQLETALDTGILFETEHLREDGTVFPVEVSSRGVTIVGQRYALSVIRDISGRRRREQELRSALDDLETANRLSQGLLRIVSGAVGRTDPVALMTETLTALRDVLEATGALLYVLEGERWVIAMQAGYPEEAVSGFSMGRDEGFAAEVAQAGDVVSVDGVKTSAAHRSAHDDLGVRSMLGVPLYLEGELYGVLECTWSEPHMISEAERIASRVAADRVMTAVASARHLRGARRSRDTEAALAEATASLANSHVLDEMMPEMLGVMARGLGCDGAVFGSYSNDRFEVRHGLGVDSGAVLDVPNHGARISASASAPNVAPVVTVGDGARDASLLYEAWGWREAIITPVSVRGEWVGALLFGRSNAGVGFDAQDKDAVRRLARVLSRVYANANDFAAEHRIAETLQEALLRLEASVPGVAYGHRYRSSTVAARVGGDFYDLFCAAGGCVGVLVGDVSGKGLAASVLTVLVKQTLRAFAHESASPAEIMERTNSVLVASSHIRDFVSVLLVVLDPESGRARYCRAGHPPALVVRRDGTVDVTGCGSPVIGALEEVTFLEDALAVGAGDLLVLYTDGVTEARNAAGEFFGEERLMRLAAALAGLGPDDAAQRIEDAVVGFSGDVLSDDVAIFVLSRG